ncbi:bifunctional 2-C-methyl-D-erythritol 4-phosphate cytidylyltransferase/2-C-methyl-D-erythritol 2,4-cyclodiphosphate synthase [Sneathiella limimaris]|uniref:bifunctional 2-C-methyl-D-erythritol 4-phosphate cytidylyltransferase/2-C-methyl-D-erythritol 2,4-cyclodiphosphate synthase n=1 Tax=Sneathiella limimaris TaxID=1964213 RepID=UPI00146B7319|nr:bifunctional 2-C-methyl-D-erythritol 4-phosphate cytidylyltransferase/2-C-methyl-D-erythritol 2,4-cyclodiphosphate synthase [Sneathiella limimaris]
MTTAALIVAAGSGSRTGLDFPKQYLKLGEKTVLRKTLEQFLDHAKVDKVQVVYNAADQDLYDDAVSGLELLPPVAGGVTRQESVLNGLSALNMSCENLEYVLIHDAARPFVSKDLINRCVEALESCDAVLPAIPATDTLKSINDGRVTGTLNRDEIVAAQTPQSFSFPVILKAHEDFKDQNVTDDIALAELAGIDVAWVMGDIRNQKITTKADIDTLMSQSLTDIRTGLGFDVHAFDSNSNLWLGGVEIPHHQGLKGHSDADVALHALTDAILGAIGEGDIGTHFPPSEAKWKGAPSSLFLEHAASLVAQKSGKIANVDLTIICEAPKISPHRDAMRAKIAEILGIAIDRVSVKGTTTEKLGFTGRSEGIAAQAVATIKLPEIF